MLSVAMAAAFFFVFLGEKNLEIEEVKSDREMEREVSLIQRCPAQLAWVKYPLE